MAISHWASPAARAAYERVYTSALGLWPIPFESRFVATRFGPTHVVVSGRPDGDPAVLIHAASLGAPQWYFQAAALGATRRLYAIDIMGDIGLSTQARPIHTRAEAADWLTGVLDGLGLERPLLVGSSFGGFQSTNLAVARPDRVGGLVLLAPAATIKPFKLLANLMIRSGSLVPMPFTVKPGLRGMMGGALPDARIVRLMETGVRGFRYDRRGIYPSEIPDADLARIACPTLVVVGDRERIYDPRAAIARAERLIPGVETEVLRGAGHLPGMQFPDAVNRLIEAFLDTRLPAVGARVAAPEPALVGAA
jgi:pimeloyl-ACP methyl ester carboxylesterase